MEIDSQEVWADYYQRIRQRMRNEAEQIWREMVQDGVTSDTFLVFDFRHFGDEQSGIRGLATQLAENYHVDVRRNNDNDRYWLLDGTTRPEGIDGMDVDRLLAWMDFLCDIGQSYGCVLSTWKLTDVYRSQCWKSESCSEE